MPLSQFDSPWPVHFDSPASLRNKRLTAKLFQVLSQPLNSKQFTTEQRGKLISILFEGYCYFIFIKGSRFVMLG